jgi:hypothetical protein
MKREILNIHRCVSGCCPGHDQFSDSTYKNNRSKRARSRDIKKEHRAARRISKQNINKD